MNDERMETVEEQVEFFAMDFEDALAWVKAGGKATRRGWGIHHLRCMWIRLVEIDGTSDFDYGKKNMPYLELRTADDTLVPWVATHEDLLAEDWMLLGTL